MGKVPRRLRDLKCAMRHVTPARTYRDAPPPNHHTTVATNDGIDMRFVKIPKAQQIFAQANANPGKCRIWRSTIFSASSRLRGLNRLAIRIALACGTANINRQNATILPRHANPPRMGFSERTATSSHRDCSITGTKERPAYRGLFAYSRLIDFRKPNSIRKRECADAPKRHASRPSKAGHGSSNRKEAVEAERHRPAPLRNIVDPQARSLESSHQADRRRRQRQPHLHHLPALA
jgi:hypothetical protein